MEAIAKARFQRISVRKARIILDMVRGKNVALALDELRFTNKAAAPIVEKLLSSAVANFENKYQQADLDKLVISRAFADKAPTSTCVAGGRAPREARAESKKA